MTPKLVKLITKNHTSTKRNDFNKIKYYENFKKILI